MKTSLRASRDRLLNPEISGFHTPAVSVASAGGEAGASKKRANRRPVVGRGAYPDRYVGIRGAGGTVGPGDGRAARPAGVGGGRERRGRAGRGGEPVGVAPHAERDHDRARGWARPG